MPGYIDIHSHILPGIDDGALDMEETRRMLLLAYEEGIRVIIATPHFTPGAENIRVESLKEIYRQVTIAAAEVSDDFQILLGNELYYNASLIEALNRGEALTMDDTRYILIEFNPRISFRELWEGLNNCIFAGFIPILAHAERYYCLTGEIEFVNDLIELGVYIQLSISCMTEHRWNARFHFCRKLLQRGWVHFLGTDMHGAYVKSWDIKKTVTYLRKKYGEEMIRTLLWENPLTMLEGEHLK